MNPFEIIEAIKNTRTGLEFSGDEINYRTFFVIREFCKKNRSYKLKESEGNFYVIKVQREEEIE